MAINLDEVRAAHREISKTPIEELIAMCAAFVYVVEKLDEDVDNIPADVVDFASEIADVAELILDGAL